MSLFSFFFKNKTNALKAFKSKNALLLDVRTKQEFDAGAITGALHIPLHKLEASVQNLKEKNRPIITYCKSGGRSLTAAALLRKNGIDALNGGGWRSLSKKLKTL